MFGDAQVLAVNLELAIWIWSFGLEDNDGSHMPKPKFNSNHNPYAMKWA